MSIDQAGMEIAVHSFSLPRLLRQVFGAEGGKLRALSASVVMAPSSKGAAARVDLIRIVAPKRYARLCLGIGDGSVHRQ